MAKCNKCGKTYLTKECIHCRDQEYKYNKKAIDSIHGKESKKLWMFSFFILLSISALLVAIAIFKIQELESISNTNYKELNRVQIKNQQLERKNDINNRLIESLTKQNKELVHQSRNRSRSRNTYTSNTTYTKPKKQTTQKTQREVRYANSTPKAKQTQRKTTHTNYQRFSSDIKLVSDSKIRVSSDGKLVSNTSIYGRYYPKAYGVLNTGKNQISSVRCELKNNRYGVEDECSMKISEQFDKMYLGKLDSKSIKDFNHKTHMIECKYSKQYGIMHGCKVKIYKYIN